MLPSSARCDRVGDLSQKADARALDKLGLETALRNHALPLHRAGVVTPIAIGSPADYRRLQPHLRALFGATVPRYFARDVIEHELLHMRAASLARRAEERTPLWQSCRAWSGQRLALGLGAVLLAIFAICVIAPKVAVWGLVIWTVITLVSVTGLRLIASVVQWRHLRAQSKLWRTNRVVPEPSKHLPRISLLVPLYKERDIAGRLVKRLAQLDYPRDRIEVCLILEWHDRQTELALHAAQLPDWMRIVRVPDGHLRTKPRAMNYAMDFLQGDVIGIYDAEDAPDSQQLRLVARAFDLLPENVACVQGILDFYNARTNWLTRCFAIDYAIWFRLVLPGLARLGAVVPLGGTTVFFRRTALETLGRWDAHNVTEDADLGLRLARHGYRCAFVPTVTEEEATMSIPAWVRQRSRWIKGYAMTWAVHMRDPLGLLGDLGFLRFLGVQILFLGTLSQFILAPFLWSFWLILFGLSHPFVTYAPWQAVVAVGGIFFLAEVITMAIAAAAVARPNHRWLIKWVPVMHLYFPLAAVASWKGFAELILRPFYWDKTAHGLSPMPEPRNKRRRTG